jgi:UDP-glucose 4-epimerase
VDVALGNVLDQDAFARAATGCDVVFHTAAVVTSGEGWEAFRRPNVDGTRNAIAAASRAGARLLHLSSVAVYAHRYEHPSEKVHEDMGHEALPEKAYYARSKRESEDMVFEAHARGDVWATAVRPCVIYGPRDRQCVPRAARALRFGIVPVIGGGRTTLPIVCAANVAQGALLAAAHDGAGGRAYNLSNDFDVTLRDFYRFGSEGLGRRVRIVSVPKALATVAFRAFLELGRLLHWGASGFVQNDTFDMIARDNPYTSARARAELGWTPRVPPERGLVDAFRWWRENH